MAASKPVIVSRQVGTSEIIQDNINGIIINNTKPEEIARQVEMLINNPKLRANIGENAYKYVRDNLSWERYAEKVETVFKQALAKKHLNV
jgi:glycosyltransferase involved in cell wall biosynthesis